MKGKSPKWHYLYFLLAGIDLLAVTASLVMNHNHLDEYSKVVESNTKTMVILESAGNLLKLAGETNAPGNDIFDSKNLPKEEPRFARGLGEFNVALSSLRLLILANVNSIEAEELEKSISYISDAMGAMVFEAKLIFTYFRKNDSEAAGSRMAEMDRKYSILLRSIEKIRSISITRQSQLLSAHQSSLIESKKFEFFFSFLILLMLAGVAIYSIKMSNLFKSISENDALRFRQIDSAQKAAKIGSWSFDIASQGIQWTRQMYENFNEDIACGPPSFERHRSTIHKADQPLWDRTVAQCLKDGLPYKMRFRSVFQNKILWMEAIGAGTFDNVGNLLSLSGTCQDVTEMVRTNEMTRLVQEIDQKIAISSTFENLIENVLNSIAMDNNWNVACYWREDSSGSGLKLLNIQAVNFEKYQDFIQHSRLIVFGEGEGLPGRVRKFQDVACIPKISEDNNFPRRPSALKNGINGALAFPVLIRDRVVGVFELFSEDLLQPISSVQNEFHALGRRVGEAILKLNAEQQVHFEQKRLQKLLDGINSFAIVATTDTRGKITSVNEKFMIISGYSHDELIGKDHRILNSGVHPREFFKQMWQEISNGNVWQGEICNRKKDGTLYWVDTVISRSIDLNGEIQYLAIRFDVSSRKLAEIAFRESQKKLVQSSKLASLGEMSAGIAHEINNPLAIVSGTVELLTKFSDNPVKFAEKIQTIRKAIGRIVKIVGGLKKFSRSSEGANFSNHEITEIVKECLVLTEIKAKRHSVHVSVDLSSNAFIYCDEVEIEQVLVNLVNNAIDAVKNQIDRSSHRWVRLKLFDDLQDVVLLVTDSGQGIPENIRLKLFDPFFTTKPIGEGTGLGLSITKGILDEHKATITVLTDAPNTCFEIRFKKVEVSRAAA